MPLDEFYAAARKTYRLRVDQILAELDAVDGQRAGDLRDALAASDIGDQTIAKVVTGWGWTLSDKAVATWRSRR